MGIVGIIILGLAGSPVAFQSEERSPVCLPLRLCVRLKRPMPACEGSRERSLTQRRKDAKNGKKGRLVMETLTIIAFGLAGCLAAFLGREKLSAFLASETVLPVVGNARRAVRRLIALASVWVAMIWLLGLISFAVAEVPIPPQDVNVHSLLADSMITAVRALAALTVATKVLICATIMADQLSSQASQREQRVALCVFAPLRETHFRVAAVPRCVRRVSAVPERTRTQQASTLIPRSADMLLSLRSPFLSVVRKTFAASRETSKFR
jgi:hypothetical protein